MTRNEKEVLMENKRRDLVAGRQVVNNDHIEAQS